MAESEKRTRTAARGWVTRAAQSLKEICDVDPVDKTSLIDGMEQFDIRINALDDAQTQMELVIEEVDLEADIISAARFRDSARKHRIRAAKILADLVASEGKDKNGSNKAGSRCSFDVAKLPRLELPEFHGNVKEWQGFWDQFTAVVHVSDLPDITKFTYLKSLLHGEAKTSIEGLPVTARHYVIACEILEKRFGRKERIIFSHIQELLNISTPAKTANVPQLWHLFDELQAHVRSLEALAITGDQYGVILTPLLLSRLPQNIRLEWAREGEGHESDLSWLLDFLQKEIQRRERSQSFKELDLPPPETHEASYESMPTVAALSATSDMCAFCNKLHSTEKCWGISGLSIPDLKMKIVSTGLCFRCLGKGHIARSCSVKCARCQGKHHRLLCRDSDNHPVEPGWQFHPQVVSHTGVTCDPKMSNTIYLQTARVVVRGKGGGGYGHSSV